MTASPDITKAFARVMGPFLAILPATIITRMEEMPTILAAFFANPALVFICGAALAALGLIVVTQHRSWSGLSAILISLMGWIFLFRGLALLVMPDVFVLVAKSLLQQQMTTVRLIFGAIFLVGLWLSYDGWRVRRPAA